MFNSLVLKFACPENLWDNKILFFILLGNYFSEIYMFLNLQDIINALKRPIHFLIFESYELNFIVFVEACCNFNDKGQLGKWDSVGARNAFDFVYAKSLVVHSSCSSSSVLKETRRLVANFSAPWSAPCKSIAPTYGELADKYNSLIFLTVDVDALAEFSNSWEISATPTFIFIKEGKQVDKFVGADNVELKKKIAAVAASKA
ncbi:hypothetical protein V6N12_032118 [Hibiscus sabdariffa]|uniref:Thioredoxin domain-containing protein n=1 Tax=Hibiscus sabdariffa TaxID=183260 RepID=A0ABR2CBP4_9ROSI